MYVDLYVDHVFVVARRENGKASLEEVVRTYEIYVYILCCMQTCTYVHMYINMYVYIYVYGVATISRLL